MPYNKKMSIPKSTKTGKINSESRIKVTHKVTNPVRKTSVPLKSGAKLPKGEGLRVAKRYKKIKGL